MRNLILGCLALLLSATPLLAQNASFEAAEDALKSYNSATTKDAMDLQKAADHIEKALEDPALDNKGEAYLVAGDVYATIIADHLRASVLDPETKMLVPDAAVRSAKAYQMAAKEAGTMLESAKSMDKKMAKKTTKKAEKVLEAAVEGLENVQTDIINAGNSALNAQDWQNSFLAYQASIDAHNFLNANDGKSGFQDEANVDSVRYYAVAAGMRAEMYDNVEPILMTLYQNGYGDGTPGIYDDLITLSMKKDDQEMVKKYLDEGRAKFPENTPLLFKEINYYLANDNLSALTDKLELAIQKEPTNPSLYNISGNVYEKLYKTEKEAGNTAKADEYFDKAKQQYEAGLKAIPDNADLIYATGALYYNRAAEMTQELIVLGDDISKEGQKKYDALKQKVDGEFKVALPYFKKAEMSDPGNVNTLLALKEMYARLDDFELSGEFKKRYEAAAAGTPPTESYFKSKGM